MQDNKVNVICDEAIAQISKGDREALSVIFDCMARMIFSVGIAITGNDADAEDVLQETMIEIVKYAHTYRSGSNARAWILSMARHRAKKKTDGIDRRCFVGKHSRSAGGVLTNGSA